MNAKQPAPGATIHFIGVCGTAMASLAGLLQKQGYNITGSDQNVYPPMSTLLETLGVTIMSGYKPENLAHNPDFVIVGNVVSRDNPEAMALIEKGIPYTSLPKAMGDWVIGERDSYVICGTHGKTTTTSILSYCADEQGLQPGYFVGGIPLNFGVSFRKGEGQSFVIEGDEYDTAYFDKVPKFIYYNPKNVILTGIEFDHVDIYSSIDEILDSFQRLLVLIPADGLLVYNGDCPNIKKILHHASCKKVSYSSVEGDYVAVERSVQVGRNQFCVQSGGVKVADLAVKQFGHHNTMNILACYVLGKELGWDHSRLLQSLASFKGVKRRQELIGEPGGITVIEDFAHHPTAVKLTVECMRERFPGRKVFSVFEPRSATSRRNIFQQDYVESFLSSDVTLITRPYNTSKIPESDRFSSDQLVRDLNSKDKTAFVYDDTESIVDALESATQPGDVILIMSNGGFDGLYGKLLDRLAKKKPEIRLSPEMN